MDLDTRGKEGGGGSSNNMLDYYHGWKNMSILHIYTYCTLKVYEILTKSFFSSFQNFLINIFIFYINYA